MSERKWWEELASSPQSDPALFPFCGSTFSYQSTSNLEERQRTDWPVAGELLIDCILVYVTVRWNSDSAVGGMLHRRQSGRRQSWGHRVSAHCHSLSNFVAEIWVKLGCNILNVTSYLFQIELLFGFIQCSICNACINNVLIFSVRAALLAGSLSCIILGRLFLGQIKNVYHMAVFLMLTVAIANYNIVQK